MTPFDRTKLLREIEPMLNNPLSNYIVPGLTSSLVGGGAFGKVRMFHANRGATDFVTPHSHRFDFTAYVLQGAVWNTLYTEVGAENGIAGHAKRGEQWCRSTIGRVCGAEGLNEYVHTRDESPGWWSAEEGYYVADSTYSMTYDQIHSIRFAIDSRVLFFEGPEKLANSLMLEPWVNGRVLPTFKTEDWMFERAAH